MTDGWAACFGAIRDKARDLRLACVLKSLEMLLDGLWIGEDGVVAPLVGGRVEEIELRRPNGALLIDMVRRNEGLCLDVGVPSRRLA